MAPINLPDGSQVSEIVLPDGSTATEVLAPDGSTVFSGIPDSVIDHFEETLYEGKGNSLSTYYDNINSSHDRNINSPVIEGNYSLKITEDPSLVYSETGDGLNRYFSKGEIASAPVYDDGGEPKLIFAAANDGNGLDCYMARHQAGNQITIEKWADGGFKSALNSASVSTNTQEWYELEIEWHDGSGTESDNTIVVRLFSLDQSTGDRQSEVANTTASDSDYSTQEGVGYQNSTDSTGTASVFDNYRYQGTV